eukprot:gnl/MRDRNA2_/MRDRNA2_28188_c0_seq1.p1 gnl/MRDRNA2_/MRDRNA2_28188_c0~~gnl/MRDRNA2_/MRDRNA2_28188_c0_seq1.p1  ORF type:complete len:224 (+),score=32.27 gnl/MRDRNA2_/MRDRNA2_28188_c0_seq1:112-783(+)
MGDEYGEPNDFDPNWQRGRSFEQIDNDLHMPVNVWWQISPEEEMGRQTIMPGAMSEPANLPMGMRHQVCVMFNFDAQSNAIPWTTYCNDKWSPFGDQGRIVYKVSSLTGHENSRYWDPVRRKTLLPMETDPTWFDRMMAQKMPETARDVPEIMPDMGPGVPQGVQTELIALQPYGSKDIILSTASWCALVSFMVSLLGLKKFCSFWKCAAKLEQQLREPLMES